MLESVEPSEFDQEAVSRLFDLRGKVIVVTGGTSGLGRAMAEAFAQQGADVVISSRKLDACEELAGEVRSSTGQARPGGRRPCRALGRHGRARRRGLRRVRARRRARQQRRHVAALRGRRGGQRGAVGQDRRGQPQGPVSPDGARRLANGRGRGRLDHQRRERRGALPEARGDPLRRRQGRARGDDAGVRARLGHEGARQRDPARLGP